MKGQLNTEQRLRQNVARLKTTNARLRDRVAELEGVVAIQQKQLETQAVQIAELQTMVFGRKRRLPTDGTPVEQIPVAASGQPRTKTSYRRSVPPATAITAEVSVPLPDACICGGSFDQATITTHERYEEDIPLPELTPKYRARLVTKYRIERGICLACGKATSAKDLGGQTVTLGPNVRLLVTHLVSVVGLSYSQIANLLLSLYGLAITDGELANIIQKQHQQWIPAYNQLKADIRAAPVTHGDETPWPIQSLQGAGYAWDMGLSNIMCKLSFLMCSFMQAGGR